MVQLYGFSTQITSSPLFNKAKTGMVMAAIPLPKTKASSAPSSELVFFLKYQS